MALSGHADTLLVPVPSGPAFPGGGACHSFCRREENPASGPLSLPDTTPPRDLLSALLMIKS